MKKSFWVKCQYRFLITCSQILHAKKWHDKVIIGDIIVYGLSVFHNYENWNFDSFSCLVIRVYVCVCMETTLSLLIFSFCLAFTMKLDIIYKDMLNTQYLHHHSYFPKMSRFLFNIQTHFSTNSIGGHFFYEKLTNPAELTRLGLKRSQPIV